MRATPLRRCESRPRSRTTPAQAATSTHSHWQLYDHIYLAIGSVVSGFGHARSRPRLRSHARGALATASLGPPRRRRSEAPASQQAKRRLVVPTKLCTLLLAAHQGFIPSVQRPPSFPCCPISQYRPSQRARLDLSGARLNRPFGAPGPARRPSLHSARPVQIRPYTPPTTPTCLRSSC